MASEKSLAADKPPAVSLDGAADTTEQPVAQDAKEKGNEGGFKDFLRVFLYNDALGWVLNVIAILCMIGAGIVLPLMDVVFGEFVNVFTDFARSGTENAAEVYRSQINHFTLYFVYLFIGKFALVYIWSMLINITGIRAVKRLRVDFVRSTLRQDIPFFDNPTTSVSSQITTNGNLISNGISEKFGIIIMSMSTFFAAFIVAFVVQWKLTLIIIAIVPVNLAVTIVCVIYDTVYEYEMFEIYSKAGTIAEEAFSSIRTAHAFWAFPKLSSRFNNTLAEARRIGNKKSLLYAILFPTEFFCVFAGYGLAFWQGMRMYTSGEIPNPGTVVTVIFAILVAAQSLTAVTPQFVAISKATAAAQDLFAVIDRKSAVDSLSDKGQTIENFTGDIKLRNVKFAYPSRPDVTILQDFSIDIPSEKTTALVGASGSGKSTVFGMLERWYPKMAGSITLDGHELESLNLQWLRTNIRLVQQEPTLFSGTIYQNVSDGLAGTAMDEVPEEEKRNLVYEACKSAFAHEFIQDLPNGYDTHIGERGASLSGGQKQRIVIARSIISNPKVLLLDEATSALDPNAEKIVQKALNNVAKGRTMIVIAHRLSTIRDADNIIVVSKGEVAEQGTHSELVALDGKYAKLVSAQDLGKKGESVESDTEGEKIGHNLDVIATEASASPSAAVIIADESTNYGLVHGLAKIFKEQRSLWVPASWTLLASIAGGVTYPALAILFAKTMEAFEKLDVPKVNFFALMFFIVAIGNLIAYAVLGWHSNNMAQTVMQVYRGDTFDNILRQDMTFFDKPGNGTGALVSRLSSEPTSIQELLAMNLGIIIITIVNLFASVVLAIAVGWKLGLVLSLGGLPLLVLSGYVRIRLEFSFEEDTAERFSQSSSLASEAVMAIRTVSSLALERIIIQRYSDALQDIATHAIGSLGWKMFFYSLSQSISFLVMGLGFWYGGRLVSFGEYSTVQFYVVFVAIIFSGEAAALFFQFTTSLTKARAAINYIFSVRKTHILLDPPTKPDAEKSDEPTKGAHVSCDEVTFSYAQRPNLKVLRGIDVDIKPGKMVAFVGASGCGKSTMIALLQRFYDPTTGQIRVDGKDIQAYDRCEYRREVALVQQEPVLYQGSIRENIALGVESGEPSEEDIIDACKQANVWDFVSSLPEGLNTACGSQGLSLSGGQRQRIAIARALIRKPRLLLLDEATSALDTESEKVVKEALDRAAAGRTTIAVAHRLSTIRDADLIAVFAKGKIIERGTHEELVARKGMYYEMVLGQSLDKEA